MKQIGKRVTYANVTATLALVLAMSGGALAASHYLITSTKQISPKVLKQLKGGPGAVGPQGPPGAAGVAQKGERGEKGEKGEATRGPEGPQGKAGTTGPEGAEGPEGPQGKVGTTGPEGAAGKEGSPWTAGGTLPSGKSEKGQLGLAVLPAAAEEVEYASISFQVPLAKPLAAGTATGVHIFENTVTNAGEGCPVGSSVFKPEAEPGNLCVFLTSHANLKFPKGEEVFNPEAVVNQISEQVGRTGVLLTTESEGAGTGHLIGDWAVTAP